MKGWHFCSSDDNGQPILNYDDGRPVVDGETLTVDCEPLLCEQGLHASANILDALYYAPNTSCLCRVTLSGTVAKGTDKAAATERRCEWHLDADATGGLLRDFARRCALDVIDLWDAPDVVREYLETGDESLRAAAGDAARDAAWDAARTAAGDAAWAAARDAAWAAARTAARDAARTAARTAAWDAAWAAARTAANQTQSRRLVGMAVEARKRKEADDE